ncbi:argininosuccinate synthetase [Colletotrichum falcatum]|nr:argininosuccinate synthetase [Colletotrichum falcatum]
MPKGTVCLAYSGGLNNSTVLAWLLDQGYEVVAYIANVGQEEDWAAVEKKALAIGAKKMIIDDLEREITLASNTNLAYCLYKAGILEDPDVTSPKDMWTMTVFPLKAPNTTAHITIHFEKGIPVFKLLNALGMEHGIGCVDIVENRLIGLKSRGCYDSPAMTILRAAHLAIEGLTLDGRLRAARDLLAKQWSQLLHNRLYYSPERAFLQPSLDFAHERVNGEVRLQLYKGQAYVLGRRSPEKLYSEEDASMDSLTVLDPADATGFIAIESIQLQPTIVV